MLKYLFCRHKYEHVRTYEETRKTYYRFRYEPLDCYIVREYYKCSKCGRWKLKVFENHILTETRYYNDWPIEMKGEKNEIHS